MSVPSPQMPPVKYERFMWSSGQGSECMPIHCAGTL